MIPGVAFPVRGRRLLPSSLLTAGLILLAVPATAQTVIDFEELACAGSGFPTSPSPYLSNGFAFSSSVAGFGNWCIGSPDYPGSTSLINNLPLDFTTLIKQGGGLFGISSIKLANFLFNSLGQSITFTGTLSNATQVFQSFLVPDNLGGSPFLTQFAFNSNFSSIVSLHWQQGSPILHQFDDVTLTTTTVIPEPLAAALLLPGLLGVGAIQLLRRRRRS